MWRLKGGWKADGTRGVSYTTGTNNLQAMMAKVGYMWPVGLSDKSVKSLAVTKAMRKGMTADNTREHGRWKTVDMPLHDKSSSLEHKEDLASNSASLSTYAHVRIYCFLQQVCGKYKPKVTKLCTYSI